MYNELYELWKKQRENENEIQQLPKKFYAKIVAYVKKLREENRMLDKKTIKAKLLSNEFKNVKIMVDELLSIRYMNILNNAVAGEAIDGDALTEEEKELYGEVLPLIEGHRAFSKDMLRGYLSKIDRDVNRAGVVLRFVSDIPALVGADMKTYGPFKPEDIATLPTENAQILIKQGMAIEVDLG